MNKRVPQSGGGRPMNGWLALSPLLVFLGIYLVTSVAVKDFYKIPIASAFLTASIYSLVIGKGTISDKIKVFSSGAGDGNVLLMIWIFVLAGAFASTAREIGSIEMTVNATLMVLPGKLIFSGLFIAACLVSMAIGTSVGTVVALVPIAAGIAGQTGIGVPMATAIIVGGAFFGDNLSFISDTTIAATRTQGCSMSDKFKVNVLIAAPAALAVAAIYVVTGLGTDFVQPPQHIDFLLLVPYVLVIVLASSGINVLAVLTIGLAVNLGIGLIRGTMGWVSFLGAIGSGIAGMGDLIIVTMLAGGMLGIIKHNGGLDFLIKGLTRHISGKCGAELSIAAIVSLANLCTANNTVAIITTGGIAKDISGRFALDARKSASILDTFSCFIQGILPYGAQMLMASGLAGVSAFSIIKYLWYPFVLGLFAVMAILFRFPKKYS